MKNRNTSIFSTVVMLGARFTRGRRFSLPKPLGACLLTLCLWAPTALNALAADQLEFNRRAMATAQIMAGITPGVEDSTLDRLTKLDTFAEHQQWMNAHWAQVRSRIAAMERWRTQELKISGARNRTLIYPFSGPDFLNAYAFFPTHTLYIFFSLERPGSMPDLESVTSLQFGKLLGDVRSAFRDIFQRNYFITDYMNKQLTTPWIRGTVPVITTMMALLQVRIQRIEPVDLFPDLTAAYDTPEAERRPRKLMRAVHIYFTGADGTPQQLYYVSVDATDKALEFYPGFLDWVAQHRPASALLKSASYLLHDNQFEKTRRMILATADFVVQDDTGVPYRYLNQPPWQVRLYGRYSRPTIKGLKYGYQADLEAAYKARGDTPELPFPFGYQWRSKQSTLMTATR